MIEAPGKLFLFGEYAVLEGAPAVVTAVDRYVRVRSSDQAYRVVGPAEPDLDLPRAVERATGRRLGGLEVDLSDMFAGEAKVGLGSSAASCVALCAAVLGVEDRDAVFAAALRAHRDYQGGRGSGADVAASTWGRTQIVAPVGETLRRREVALPAGLNVVAVWTGRSADTRAYVDAVRRTSGALEGLHRLAAEAADAFATADASRIVELARAYDEALGALGEAAGVPIRIDAHARIADVASELGAAAKPSGAGGGDVSLVFSEHPLDLGRFGAALPRGARTLDLGMDAAGVNSFPDPG